MLRLRLASLAVASGLLFTLSGCASFGEDGRFFPRIFRSNSTGPSSGYGMPSECECQDPHLAGMETSALMGPILSPQSGPGQTVPIPITSVPTNQPPQIFKIPQASPRPYVPTN